MLGCFLLLHFWHSSHSLQEEPEICPKQVIEVIEAKADDVPSRPSMATGTTPAVTRTSRPAAAAPAAPAPQMQPPEEAKDGDDGGLAGTIIGQTVQKHNRREQEADKVQVAKSCDVFLFGLQL